MQLKKYVSGTGKARKKELIILDVFKNFGEEIRDNNIADAYVLSRIARDYTSGNNLKKHQEDVIKKLKNKTKEII
jgi:Holliday junction resolvasome RuvABC endonuclease subunit